jgi:type III secretory pathway component EscU
MALTICVKCDKTYIETLKQCPHCNLTVEEQIVRSPCSLGLKVRIVGKWLFEAIFDGWFENAQFQKR